mgnify:CR=1 FL=1
MATTQISFTNSLIMIVLFVVAIIGFSIGFATDNNAAMSISDDPELSSLSTSTRENLSKFKDDSEGTYESILSSTIEPGSGAAQSTAPFAVTPLNVIGVTKNIVALPYYAIFGSGSGFGIFFTTLGAFLAFIFGLLLYKTLRGNP